MSNFEILLDIIRSVGANDARTFRTLAKDLTQTQIIDGEIKIPEFNHDFDYSSWPVGAPIKHQDQIYTLITPYNAANYEGGPAELRAIWGLCHTQNPLKAKPWVDPLGTSGMYLKDECYKDENGIIYRCLADSTVYKASDYAAHWEIVEI